MAETYYHHSHQTAQSESESIDQRAETISRTSEQVLTVPVTVPRPPANGIQATSSFHSVSSVDSSAEMARYFPDAQTPSLSPFRHHQEDSDQQTQSGITTTTTTAITTRNTIESGPYRAVPAPATVQPARAPVLVPQQVQASVAPQFPAGFPGYSSQIEGLAVSQAIVNDVLIDLQSKVINETQQQYYNDSSSGSYFEPLSPIYIRAPNPTIILRSDLHRLRAQLAAKPPGLPAGGLNQFQRPSFPPPSQTYPS